MQIIGKKRLLKVASRHAECVSAVQHWCKLTGKATWHNPAEVRRTFSTAPFVEGKGVFNIKGYRLITLISYEQGNVYPKDLLTHPEYDTGAWKSKY